MEYVIEIGKDSGELTRRVNKLLRDGWTLAGGVSVSWNYITGDVRLYQSLTRKTV